jgi:hypothetical protein
MHNYLIGRKRTELRNAVLAGGRFLVSFKRALGVLTSIISRQLPSSLH